MGKEANWPHRYTISSNCLNINPLGKNFEPRDPKIPGMERPDYASVRYSFYTEGPDAAKRYAKHQEILTQTFPSSWVDEANELIGPTMAGLNTWWVVRYIMLRFLECRLGVFDYAMNFKRKSPLEATLQVWIEDCCIRINVQDNATYHLEVWEGCDAPVTKWVNCDNEDEVIRRVQQVVRQIQYTSTKRLV